MQTVWMPDLESIQWSRDKNEEEEGVAAAGRLWPCKGSLTFRDVVLHRHKTKTSFSSSFCEAPGCEQRHPLDGGFERGAPGRAGCRLAAPGGSAGLPGAPPGTDGRTERSGLPVRSCQGSAAHLRPGSAASGTGTRVE